MFREMRRNKQLLPQEETNRILTLATSGVLALQGDQGYPYALPISFAYSQGRIYFHSASAGHKVEAVGRCPKASFCVVAGDQVRPEAFTTHYTSVIAFGLVRVLEDPKEIRGGMEALVEKYCPQVDPALREKTIAQGLSRTCVLEMEIQHITGKEALELAKARQAMGGLPGFSGKQ